MLGLGLESTQFPRPLGIFDNKYALQLDGVAEGVHIPRHYSMLSNSFTIGMFVGDCEDFWDNLGGPGCFISNFDSSGFNLEYDYKRMKFTVAVKHPTQLSSQEIVTAVGPYNKMSYSGGTGFGAGDNYSTGNGGYTMVVGVFDGGALGGAKLQIYVGGGVDNEGAGIGNDVHLAGEAQATNGGTEVAYGVNSWSDDTDVGVGCSDINAEGKATEASAITMDSMFYFDIALTQETLRSIYNNGKGIDMLSKAGAYGAGAISALKSHLRFEEGSGGDGDVVQDASGTGNNGTIIGSPNWVTNVSTIIT